MTNKDLKIKIKGIQSIRKITKAMQMVSASKLRSISEKLLIATMFFNVTNSIFNFNKNDKNQLNSLVSVKGDTKKVVILVTSDRGLCGSHNNGIYKYYSSLKNTSNNDLIIIGSKGIELFNTSYSNNISIVTSNLFKKGDVVLDLIEFSSRFNKYLLLNNIGEVQIIFNKFISSIKSEISDTTIKIDSSMIDVCDNESNIINLNLFFLSSYIYNAIFNSKTSEESIRMSSMDNATSSATEVLDKLTTLYNRSRQMIITTQLIEIISGSDALDKSNS